jgi:NodT family efflux transporter outer membrane factor (OMF) lipoprotein
VPAACLVALLLTACRTPAAAPPIDLAVPGAFSANGEATAKARWWTSLDDPALDPLVERALRGNPSLGGIAARLRRARAEARVAGADQDLQLDAAYRAARTTERREVDGASGSSRETDSASSHSLGLAASYELDLWGRLEDRTAAFVLDAVAAEADLSAAAITLSAEVARTWYAVVEARGQLALLARQLATNRQVLDVIELRFDQGGSGATDVLQQRQLIESIDGDRETIESDLAVATHRLSTLLGESPRSVAPPPGDVLPALPPLPRLGVPSTLLRERPDLRAALERVRAADRRVAAALAESYPRIVLTFDLETSSDHPVHLFEQWLARLAAGIVAPLLDGGAREAETDVRRAERDAALHDYHDAVLTALNEVEDALERERRQALRIASLDRQLEVARQVTERVRDAYAGNGDDFLRVLSALLTEQDLERRRLTTTRSLVESRIALHRALATGFPLEDHDAPVTDTYPR